MWERFINGLLAIAALISLALTVRYRTQDRGEANMEARLSPLASKTHAHEQAISELRTELALLSERIENHKDEYDRRFNGIGEMLGEEHTSELQSRLHLVCRLLLENKTA